LFIMWKSVAGTWVAVNNFCTDFSIEVFRGIELATPALGQRPDVGVIVNLFEAHGREGINL